MFAFLSYNGVEPGWASAMRESSFPGLNVYSPGLTLEDQLEAIGDDLSAREPNVLSYTFSNGLRLEKSMWLSLCDALPTLLAADTCTVTSQMIYRDLYLLVRSDVLIVDAHSTNELAVYAFLLGIPVVAVSYSPTGLHPWLSHCAGVTINSPESIQEILDALTPATPNVTPPREERPELPSEPEEVGDRREFTCKEGHVFESRKSHTECIVEDCGAEGVAACGSPVTLTSLL